MSMMLQDAVRVLGEGARAVRRPSWPEEKSLSLVRKTELWLGRMVPEECGCGHVYDREVFRQEAFTTEDMEANDYELSGRKTWFVSGHMDLTEHEFNEHYKPTLLRYLRAGDSFIVGDAPGADLLAQRCLSAYVGLRLFPVCQARVDVITVYHMLALPRHNPEGLPTVGGFLSDRARDEAMTAASDGDVAWVRPGREKSGTASNLKRRTKALAAQKDG